MIGNLGLGSKPSSHLCEWRDNLRTMRIKDSQLFLRKFRKSIGVASTEKRNIQHVGSVYLPTYASFPLFHPHNQLDNNANPLKATQYRSFLAPHPSWTTNQCLLNAQNTCCISDCYTSRLFFQGYALDIKPSNATQLDLPYHKETELKLHLMHTKQSYARAEELAPLNS